MIGWPVENSRVLGGPIYIRIDEEVYNSTLQHHTAPIPCAGRRASPLAVCRGPAAEEEEVTTDHWTIIAPLSPREKAHDCHVSRQSLALLPRHPVVRCQIIHFKSLVFLTASSTFKLQYRAFNF